MCRLRAPVFVYLVSPVAHQSPIRIKTWTSPVPAGDDIQLIGQPALKHHPVVAVEHNRVTVGGMQIDTTVKFHSSLLDWLSVYVNIETST
jgi:hypothetical protein